MSQYDKDDVETLGFLKLDVLGIRMQSAMSYAISEIERVEDKQVELDSIPFDDPQTFELIQSTKTLGCFQIESPGQRELIGKFSPTSFNDIIIDISLFRPGPVKSDMITPFLNARHGFKQVQYLHPNLAEIVAETSGVVVFHEQVIKLIAALSGCTWAEADEVRRSFSDNQNLPKIRAWLYPKALKLDYDLDVIEEVWAVLKAFASFGFCKAHAGAFALPTYQSAWLKTHHRAAFYAGVLTHDPGMYPKRLIVEDARQMGVPILGLDINLSRKNFVVEEVEDGYGVRIALSQIKNISDAEVDSIIAAQPFADINDMWQRTTVSRPVMQSLVLAGAFDALHQVTKALHQNRNTTTRRDLYVHVNELARNHVAKREELLFAPIAEAPPLVTGLPEMDELERVQAELEILGIDVSHHVIDFYKPLLQALNVVPSSNLLNTRSNQEIFVAGVKVAAQTPPVRSGKRVIFVTLDDSTGPIDAAFFEDTQADYSHTLLNSWTLLMRGVTRRTDSRGVSVRGTGCWALADVQAVFAAAGKTPWGFDSERAVAAVMDFIENDYEINSNLEIIAPQKLWHSSPGIAG
jgi:error-prone DNA polymerase